MANVLTVVWFLVGYIATLTGTLVWVALMLPGPVARARARVESKPAVHFFLGLLFWAVTLALAGTLIGKGKSGGAQLVGWMVAGPVLAGSLVGNAAVASILAERMRATMRRDSPLLGLIGGALCTVLGALVPIVGWFVFAPLVGLTAVGAGTLGIFTRDRRPKPEPAPLPVAPAVPPTPSWTREELAAGIAGDSGSAVTA